MTQLISLPRQIRRGKRCSVPSLVPQLRQVSKQFQRFWIRERFRVANPEGPYGPRAFGTSAYSRLSDWPGGGVIGIHGTDEPRLIPGRPSHGCIRLPNHAIGRLYRLMPVGTPVSVR